MQKAYIVRGTIKDHKTIDLQEDLPVEDGEITIAVIPKEIHARGSRPSGTWKDKIQLSEDFDAPLEDFADYM